VIRLAILKATEKDREDIFQWRNDSETRRFSKNIDLVSWQSHVRCFEASLISNDRTILIGHDKRKKIGMVRLDKNLLANDRFTVSIVVAPEHRGVGYGKKLLEGAILMTPDCVLDAEIKEDNIASKALFMKCGFRLALQLRSPFYMGSAGFGLMCASPDGPCDDVGGPDASLRKTNSDAPDFLN
jgi:RimJ/RimL family protein N-acetyltransferase